MISCDPHSGHMFETDVLRGVQELPHWRQVFFVRWTGLLMADSGYPGDTPFYAGRGSRTSSSSTVRGQSPLSSFDSARSASTLPPVWQRGQ